MLPEAGPHLGATSYTLIGAYNTTEFSLVNTSVKILLSVFYVTFWKSQLTFYDELPIGPLPHENTVPFESIINVE